MRRLPPGHCWIVSASSTTNIHSINRRTACDSVSQFIAGRRGIGPPQDEFTVPPSTMSLILNMSERTPMRSIRRAAQLCLCGGDLLVEVLAAGRDRFRDRQEEDRARVVLSRS